jgi:hypothetical protein
VSELSQSFRVGKHLWGHYVKVMLDTGRGWLTTYLVGVVLKRWRYKLLNKQPTLDSAAAGGCRRLQVPACVDGPEQPRTFLRVRQ